ncbi:MAG: hypothetical protein ACI4UU_04510 [Clostridia bacterium]
MSRSSSMPLAPGECTQEMIDKIKRDASMQTFNSSAEVSRSTLFRSHMMVKKSNRTYFPYSVGKK